MEAGIWLWLTLAKVPGVGRKRLAKLMEVCPDPDTVLRMRVCDLAEIEGWTRGVAQAAVTGLRQRDLRQQARSELERALGAGLRVVPIYAPDYPLALRHIPDPPAYFYQAGPWSPDQRPVIAIVGTRKPTSYGLAVAEKLGRELAEAGAVVVSGMARGIDCAAHRGCLAARGQTVAVLGGGADVCYPKDAVQVYRHIRESGAVISEQPPGTPPESHHFPERNRMISGLATATIVVEAGERSGTLITVGEAIAQGREVYAVPGPVTSPMSIGPNLLIKDGAGMALSAQQVLSELGFTPTKASAARSRPALSADEQRLLLWFGDSPRYAEEIGRALGSSPAEVQALLTMLQVRGLLKQLPDGQYIRTG